MTDLLQWHVSGSRTSEQSVLEAGRMEILHHKHLEHVWNVLQLMWARLGYLQDVKVMLLMPLMLDSMPRQIRATLAARCCQLGGFTVVADR